ncbi:hypothetical protein [Agrobacterium tumefaciens]|nr:hypothetical protein [Agrobacterium tumefaciens]
MGSVNFVDLEEIPKTVQTMIEMRVRNAVHSVSVLQEKPYPVYED